MTTKNCNPFFIEAAWPAPKNIHALTTTRYCDEKEFNLASHTGDDVSQVKQNRKQLINTLKLPSEPVWLNQVHSTIVVNASHYQDSLEADASYSDAPNLVCAVLTADCLPILICNQAGTEIAAIHAGWRGLAHGIIEKTLETFKAKPDQLLAWLGPAIGPQAFQVGQEVREIFISHDPNHEDAFIPQANHRWLANLYLLAKKRLQEYGIMGIYGGNWCTFSDEKLFYSYRRDNKNPGRIASLIWREN